MKLVHSHIKEAIVLAGGLGTRLKSVIFDIPKPMAPLNQDEVPFLQILLDKLNYANITHVVLATGYKHDCIERYFSNQYKDIHITYSREESALFTGGAIKRALQYCKSEDVFVLNGDTFFDIDLNVLYFHHKKTNADVTIALKEMAHFDRYGTVKRKNGRIIRFIEKEKCSEGFINGGIYCLKKTLLDNIELKCFSFEKDFLFQNTQILNIQGKIFERYFIDIGIPEDYLKMKKYYREYLE